MRLTTYGHDFYDGFGLGSDGLGGRRGFVLVEAGARMGSQGDGRTGR